MTAQLAVVRPEASPMADPTGAPTPARPAYLQISGLWKAFGEFVALRDIDLEVHEGEFVCFLGPSGCGKTTLLRAIAGLDLQSRGSIVQAGRDISALPASSRDYGIVFQSYALFPNLTIERNIAFGLENTRGRAPRSRRGSRSCSSSSGSRPRPESTRRSSPAASSSGWRSPAPWRSRRACCCSTSRCRRSTPRSASTCATRSRSCSASSASPPSWSPTTRRRRCRWPTASW